MPDTYHSPYANSIADLLLRKGQIVAQGAQAAGDAEARQRMASGAAWGNAIQGVGQAVAGSLRDYTQYKEDAPKRALIDAQTKSMNAKLADEDEARRMGHAGQIAQMIAANQFHPDAIAQGFGEIAKLVPEHAAQLQRAAGDPTAAKAVVEGLLPYAPGYEKPQGFTLSEGQQRFGPHGEPLAEVPKSVPPPQPYTLGPGQQRLSPTGEVLASVPAAEPKPPAPPQVGSFEDFVVSKFGPRPTPEQVLSARKEYSAADDRPQAQGAMNALYGDVDPQALAGAIMRGEQVPDLVQYGRPVAAAVGSVLAKEGYNLQKAKTDWTATQKHFATLNGAQQTRLRQAVVTAQDSLGVIEDLAKQWNAGRFPLLNKANLAAAKSGVMGKEAQQIATNLTAQITDVTSELGNVYMGGNSPTDHALSLAGKNLSADWNRDQLLSAINLARTNLQIRRNSIENVGPITTQGTTAAPERPADLVYDPATKTFKKAGG